MPSYDIAPVLRKIQAIIRQTVPEVKLAPEEGPPGELIGGPLVFTRPGTATIDPDPRDYMVFTHQIVVEAYFPAELTKGMWALLVKMWTAIPAALYKDFSIGGLVTGFDQVSVAYYGAAQYGGIPARALIFRITNVRIEGGTP